MGERGHSFLVRALTAVVLIAVVGCGVIFSRYGFLLLVVAACAVGIYEFLSIAGASSNKSTGAHAGASSNGNAGADTSAGISTGIPASVSIDTGASVNAGIDTTAVKPPRILSIAVGIVAIVLAFLVAGEYIGARWMTLLIPLVAVLFVAELYRKKEMPLANISAALGSLIYVAAPLCLLCVLAIKGRVYNPWIVLAIVGIVAVNDIFAYITGILLGKHRLMERISPKKSWEGFFGGLIFAVGAAILCGWLAGDSVIHGSVRSSSDMAAMLFWGGLGLVIVAGAVLGDLVESMFKRAAGVKDSGNLFPGHGGMLDRLDALLLTIPLVYTYLVIFGA